MITLHHLENSRSQRVLWLLEELGAPYALRRYERDKQSGLAPEALRKVHPLGKSPVIEEDGAFIAETGAILEHILAVHGKGRLVPAAGGADQARYRYWMHAAEGSFMPPLVLALVLSRMERAPMPFFARPIAKRLVAGVRERYLGPTLAALFDYLESELQRTTWLAGDAFSAADIMMSFPIEVASDRIGAAKSRPAVGAFLQAIHARPAYQRALEKGGPYAYG